MDITPPSRPAFAPISTQTANRPNRTKANAQSPEIAAQEVEREAHRRIAAAGEEIQQAQVEQNVQLARLKEDHEVQKSAENFRHEASLESQRNRGYEQIRDLQRAQQAELARVRREGERELAKAKDYYRDSIYNLESQGKTKLNELQTEQSQQLDHTKKMAIAEREEVAGQQSQQIARLREEGERKTSVAIESATKEYERIKSNAHAANEDAHRQFESQYASIVEGQTEALNRINQFASGKVNQIRQDTASKLAAYGSRQNDPFYKLMDLDARLSDEGDRFLLIATVPEHEQEHVTVSMKGNQIMISGYRRNEEKIELSPGRTKGTATFQSFSETFPLDWPVESKLLERRFEGDQLVVSVPKKKMDTDYKPYQPPKPDRIRVQRPHFPENIPHVQESGEKVADSGADGSSNGSKRTNRPLG